MFAYFTNILDLYHVRVNTGQHVMLLHYFRTKITFPSHAKAQNDSKTSPIGNEWLIVIRNVNFNTIGYTVFFSIFYQNHKFG